METLEDRAKRLEKKASFSRNAARAVKDSLKKETLLKESSKLYEQVGEIWNKIAEVNENYPRKVRFATKNAEYYSGLAKRIGENPKTRAYAFLSIISLTFAFFFVSLSMTGNIILGLTETNSRWIGICLFVCGLTFALLYSKKKK